MPHHFICNFDNECPEEAPKCDIPRNDYHPGRNICYNPCHSLSCGEHGECSFISNSNPELEKTTCICEDGYSNYKDSLCIQDYPNCDLECSGHGYCSIIEDTPKCVCDDEYSLSTTGEECLSNACSSSHYPWMPIVLNFTEDYIFNDIFCDEDEDEKKFGVRYSNPGSYYFRLKSSHPNILMTLSNNSWFGIFNDMWPIYIRPGESVKFDPRDYNTDSATIKVEVENPNFGFDYTYSIDISHGCQVDSECEEREFCIDGECYEDCGRRNCMGSHMGQGDCYKVPINQDESQFLCRCDPGYKLVEHSWGEVNCIPDTCPEELNQCHVDESILNSECLVEDSYDCYSIESQGTINFIYNGCWCVFREEVEQGRNVSCLMVDNQPTCVCKYGLVLAEDGLTCVYQDCTEDDFVNNTPETAAIVNNLPYTKENLSICPNKREDYFKINYTGDKKKKLLVTLNGEAERFKLGTQLEDGTFTYTSIYLSDPIEIISISNTENIISVSPYKESYGGDYSINIKDHCDISEDCGNVDDYFSNRCINNKCVKECRFSYYSCNCVNGLCRDTCDTTDDCEFDGYSCVGGYCK